MWFSKIFPQLNNLSSGYQILLVFAILLIGGFSCENATHIESTDTQLIDVRYAKGFTISQGEGFSVIEVLQAFPGSHPPFRYLVLESISSERPSGEFDAIITLPLTSLVVTSTTHIPHLDVLDATDLLIGFPEPGLISSEKARQHIDLGKVRDLGSSAQANIEMIIDLSPDLVMMSTLGEDLKNLEFLQNAGVPTIINGEYVEQHPLGRAEWIKVTGALLGKSNEAEAIFKEIEREYLSALAITENLSTTEKPTVMSGIMYKDVWFVPGNDSWGTQLLKAAGGNYIFENESGTGSTQLNFEYVLDQAQHAEFWIGASDFQNLSSMKSADNRYTHFEAFQNGNVFTYTLKLGATGGIEYFELGYMRPDLILKDLIKIMHPKLLPDYSLYFYAKLNEE